VIEYVTVKFSGQTLFDVPKELQGKFFRVVIDGEGLSLGPDFKLEQDGTKFRLIDSHAPFASSTVIVTDE